MFRGTLQFELSRTGGLLNSARNVELLRNMWLHKTLVQAADLGPGDRGDFDKGAWHVACHLVAAGGVRRRRNGALLWLEISHDASRDEYYASVTSKHQDLIQTVPLDSADGRTLTEDSTVTGFVEGTSKGRISAHFPNDSPERFNLWRRQDFDQHVHALADGGRVWEHWCTLRDITPASSIGTSVVTAYISLAASLGDRFAAAVSRGRRSYGHPVQLAASVHAGFISRQAALWNTRPVALPHAVEPLFYAGTPEAAFEGVERLDWSAMRYYMFKRRIQEWCSAKSVRGSMAKRLTANRGD